MLQKFQLRNSRYYFKTLSYDDESGFGRFIRKSVLNFLRYGGGCRFYYLFIT